MKLTAMFGYFAKWLAASEPKFPPEKKGHWYCGTWYLHLADLRDQGLYHGTTLDPRDVETPAEGTICFNPCHTGHADSDTSGLIDGLIPAIRVGDEIGLYKQVGPKYRTEAFFDGAPWDDGYHIDLRFVRAINAADELERKRDD